jgi:Zn-dependent alcohol dehydrogenase
VVAGAHLAGACPVIAVDLHDHKLAVAARHGATHVVNSSKAGLVEEVRRILERATADVVVDGTGRPEVLELALELAGPQGRVIGVGVMPHDRKLSVNTLQFHFGKVLRGSHGGGSQPADDIPRILRLIRHRRFDPSGFVSHRTTLVEINQAIAAMRAGAAIHTIIQFEDSGLNR